MRCGVGGGWMIRNVGRVIGERMTTGGWMVVEWRGRGWFQKLRASSFHVIFYGAAETIMAERSGRWRNLGAHRNVT